MGSRITIASSTRFGQAKKKYIPTKLSRLMPWKNKTDFEQKLKRYRKSFGMKARSNRRSHNLLYQPCRDLQRFYFACSEEQPHTFGTVISRESHWFRHTLHVGELESRKCNFTFYGDVNRSHHNKTSDASLSLRLNAKIQPPKLLIHTFLFVLCHRSRLNC